jgi:hypothetical protein
MRFYEIVGVVETGKYAERGLASRSLPLPS